MRQILLAAPLVDILTHALLQFLAVVVDQLAGEDDKPALTGLKTLIQHLSQLTGERAGRLVSQFAGRIIDDAGLSGVGYNVLQIIRNGYLHHLIVAILLVGIQATGNGRNNPLAVYLLTVFCTSQVQGVQSLLPVNEVGQTLRDGLHKTTLSVPVCLFVGNIEPVVDEGPQEVTLTKLQHLLRCIFQNIADITGLFQHFIIEFIHLLFLQIYINSVLVLSRNCYKTLPVLLQFSN